jgi:D-glycero-alpha-D-manno-heptose-7-phosphate kinase
MLAQLDQPLADVNSRVGIRAKAPLRISFAGGGTDVPPYPETHGGCVLNATIRKFAYGSLRARHDNIVRLESLDLGLRIEFDVGQGVVYDGQLDLVKAALKRLGALNSHGFEMFLHTDAPPGSGLGSSSALVIALVGLVKEFKGVSLSAYDAARMAYIIERRDLGISGGLQDQYAAAFGGFNLIEFEKDRVIVNPLRVDPATVNELEHNLLLCYTGLTRRSDGIIDDQTRRLATNDASTLRALTQQKELALSMKNALVTHRLSDFGELLHAAWTSKKDLSPRITNPRIDELYEEARRAGAIGGKITGAGGGGHILFYCNFEKKHGVAERLRQLGAVPASVAFESSGLQTWRVYGD